MSTTRITMDIPGGGGYTYDQDIYDDVMKMKADEILAELIRRLENFDNEPGERTRYRSLRKAQRAAILSWWLTGERDAEHDSVQPKATRLVSPQSPVGLGGEFDDDQPYDDPTGGIAAPDDLGNRDVTDAEIQDFHNEQSDAELIDFTREVMESSGYTMPITETNCITPTGKALLTLVQIGSKLFWGTLVAVVNRRTKFCEPLLCTVEIDGVRRLVDANHVLAGDVLEKVG